MRWSRPAFPTRLLTTVLITLLSAPALGAQQAAVLSGRVLDSTTGGPLLGVFVSLDGAGAGVYSDSSGAFRLPVTDVAGARVSFSQVGYHTTTLPSDAWSGRGTLDVRLVGDPAVQKEVAELLHRLAERRMQLQLEKHVLDEGALASFRGDMTAFAVSRLYLVPGICRATASLVSTPRSTRAAYSPIGCGEVRGTPVFPLILIDEGTGADYDLRSYAPQDFYLVEVYGRGQAIFAYTRDWIERKAVAGFRPRPF